MCKHTIFHFHILRYKFQVIKDEAILAQCSYVGGRRMKKNEAKDEKVEEHGDRCTLSKLLKLLR